MIDLGQIEIGSRKLQHLVAFDARDAICAGSGSCVSVDRCRSFDIAERPFPLPWQA
jgi:hypothetical protein